ncbi:MAG: saccharopine dehydrogenase NADP-binding domain-containing protein [Deltaproteobacteria bacterium]|nr:saccharopine dehydrogenase NADP-binding domain-containing protein [Deltaproteobacteria bacterium]
MRSRLHGIGGKSHYAAILGSSPSRGARSPALWNAVFSALEVDCVFGAYDVVEEELGSVVGSLKADPGFIGGAVAAPYKSSIVPHLDEVEPEAEKIGAVNAMYRRGKSLVGANTDGQGAMASLVNLVGDADWIPGKRVLVLGVGGAGKAVATYLAKGCGSKGAVWLWNRTESKAEGLVERLKSYGCMVRSLRQAEIPAVLSETDLLVNCTTVGSTDQAPAGAARLVNELATPLAVMDLPAGSDGEAEVTASVADIIGRNVAASLEMLAKLPSRAIVFDIIYRPPVTMLLKLGGSLGLRTLNGLGMNLEQAVIACRDALVHSGLWDSQRPVDTIRQIMRGVP